MNTQPFELLQNFSTALQSGKNGLGMVENLIAQFNRREENSKLKQYIARQNIFDLLGKSRDEMTHSKMVAELLGGRYFVAGSESSAIHFLDLIVRRAASQGIDIPEELRKAILCRSIMIDSVEDKRYEYPVKNYLHYYQKKTSKSLCRLDVYLRYSLNEPIKKNGRQTMEFFIENKVLSQEHNDQTQEYYNLCGNAKHALQFFIYLTADKVTDEVFTKPIAKDGKGNQVFINISYQDLLDEVIMPIISMDHLPENDRVILKEYVNCLELPAYDDSLKKKNAKAQFSIMATSDIEKVMLRDFISDESNSQLMQSCISAALGRPFFHYSNNEMLTFRDALQKSIRHSLKYNGVYKTLEKYYTVIGKQNSSTPFLIYGEPADEGKIEYVNFELWEYDLRPFASLSDALLAACKDFIERYPDKDIVKSFYSIYGRQKNGCPLFARTDDNVFLVRPELIEEMGRSYQPTAFNGLLVRKNVDLDRVGKINEILGDGYSIREISPECFNRMLSDIEPQFKLKCDSKDYINIVGTKLYFRKGYDKYLNPLCEASNISKSEAVSEYDKSLLLEFYRNHRPMVLSLLRMMVEEESDEETRDAYLSDFKILAKV